MPGIEKTMLAVPSSPGFWQGFTDMTWRSTLRLDRDSASIVSVFVTPGLFVLAFWAVFGHATSSSGFDYTLFLMTACMSQATLFTAGGSILALTVNVESGLLAWMRAMPISAAVTIGGRLAIDLPCSLTSAVTVAVLGPVCGAEPDSRVGAATALGAVLAMGEVLVLLSCGTTLRSAQSVQVVNLIQTIEMPLLMLSTTLMPVETLPDQLEPIVRHMPFLPLIDVTRTFLTDSDPGDSGWEVLAWIGGGLALGAFWVLKASRRRQA